jgi:EAL domain-containing protein (putative c-di-GMP-specific phosphodiesterase class I)
MSVNAMERLELENSIRNAIENNEMVIHYQPVIDIHNNEIAGVEALLRWQHPEKGMIEPDDFLQVAIESGLIVAIGEWMVNTVCHQLRVWKEAGMENQNVSINLTAKQFKDQDLLALFKQAMAEHQIEGSELTIEVTEKTLITSEGEIESTLNKLHDLGLKIAVDDFGIGFASLTNLKDLPIDVVKIDQKFISGVPDSEPDTAVVTAIAGLTRGLKMTLFAEGIENERQLNMLKGLGCQLAQGFYWSKALPADQYEQFYLNRFYNLA